jgi:hypothetical protein
MKATNNTRFAGTSKLVAGLLLAGSFLAPMAAKADPDYMGKFTLAHETRWGTATLPAGDYTMSVDTNSKTIWIRNVATRKVAVEFAEIGVTTKDSPSEIHIAVRGDERVVSEVEISEVGEVYSMVHPFGKERRNTEEANSTASEIIYLAEK